MKQNNSSKSKRKYRVQDQLNGCYNCQNSKSEIQCSSIIYPPGYNYYCKVDKSKPQNPGYEGNVEKYGICSVWKRYEE